MKITIEATQKELTWLDRYLRVQISLGGIIVEKDGTVSGLHSVDKILMRVHRAALVAAKQGDDNE